MACAQAQAQSSSNKTNSKPATPNAKKKPDAPIVVAPAVTGTGTLGRLTKWIAFTPQYNTIGDSTIAESTSGNIGIGTITPGSKLTVQGMIETTLGGYKFPDGTVQTTAASGLTSVFHDGTLTGNGTSGSPLGVSVPLILSGSVGFQGGVIQVTNTAEIGSGIEANGGPDSNGFGGDGVRANGGIGGRGGRGVLAVGGGSKPGLGGVGVQADGGASDSGSGGDGVRANGGISVSGGGGVGVRAKGGFTNSGNGGQGVIASGGDVLSVGGKRRRWRVCPGRPGFGRW
jgi:hypothetical protein